MGEFFLPHCETQDAVKQLHTCPLGCGFRKGWQGFLQSTDFPKKITGFFHGKTNPEESMGRLYIYLHLLGGGFKYFLCSSLPGEMIQFD